MLNKTIIGYMLALFAVPLAAHAEMPGQPCTAAQIGTTKMADDKQNIIACLLTGKAAPENVQEWKAMSSGGGGVPTYLGLTRSAYTGNLGGYTGANAKCVAEFGTGARMMSLADSKRIGRASPYPGTGWFDCEESTYYTGGPGAGDSLSCSAGGGQRSTLNCFDWSYGNNNYYGTTITSTGKNSGVECVTPTKIHCVKD